MQKHLLFTRVLEFPLRFAQPPGSTLLSPTINTQTQLQCCFGRFSNLVVCNFDLVTFMHWFSLYSPLSHLPDHSDSPLHPPTNTSNVMF